MPIRTPKKFEKFGFIDSDVYAEGRPVSAFLLDTLARNSNTFREEKDCYINIPFNVNENSTSAMDKGMYRAPHLLPGWQPILFPMPFLKRPHCKSVRVHVVYEAPSSAVHFQAATDAAPVRPDARLTDPNVAGSNNVTSGISSVTMDVEVSQTSRDTLYLYMRTVSKNLAPSTTQKVTGDFGTGEEFELEEDRVIWNYTGTPADLWVTGAGGATSFMYTNQVILFTSGTNNAPISGAHKIVSLTYRTDARILHFEPDLDSEEMKVISQGGSFFIRQAGYVQLLNVAVYENGEL